MPAAGGGEALPAEWEAPAPPSIQLDGVGLGLFGLRDIYASPVAAADRIYVTGRGGTTVVVSHEDTPRLLARNRLDDRFNASAVLVDGEILLRGERHLYSLADSSKKP